MVRIAIIIGSTRPGRIGPAVAKWAYGIAKERTDAEFELVDIADYHLPLLDEPELASTGKYAHAHTIAWSKKIAEFDGYVFVTPEYNHTTCAALKNAIDYLYKEWNNKTAGFVSYGGSGGIRAVELLRPVMSQMQMADVAAQVALPLFSDFDENDQVKPSPRRKKEMNAMLDQVIAWARALAPLRAKNQ